MNSWFPPCVVTTSQDHWFTSMFKKCFVLGNLFVTFRIPAIWVLILFTCEPDKTGKIMLLFSFFCQSRIWKVPCDTKWQDIQNKREILSGLFPACQQVTVTLGFCVLLILIDYFASCYWNEEIVESSGLNNKVTY